MMRTLTISLLAWVTLVSLAAGGERMTPEKLWELGRLGSSCANGDATWLAFTVRRYDLKENTGSSDIHLLDLRTRQERLLVGGLTSGFCVAVFMANAGGAWDNAKKHIESGVHGGKGTEAHKAAVVGDTVGDPFKDTSGPSLNILVKLMSMVSVVAAGLVVRFSLEAFGVF